MEAGSILSSSFNPPKTLLTFICKPSSARFPHPHGRRELLLPCATLPLIIDNPIGTSASNYKDTIPRIDKSGKFCSPRAARELALMTLYAAFLEGSDPVRLFEKRLNARKEIGYEFDRACLMEYDHMSFGGPPVATQTIEEADGILRNYQKESHIEAEVLSAPPKLVYSKLILLFTRKLLAAVSENWESSVVAIGKVAPDNWKNEPASRILEFSILHLAMSEIAVLGTRHQIVINEAVDLAKRFCDGSAPRVVNGCLRTFLKELKENGEEQPQNG
ncbi:uncharacterized protein LOC130992654 [Salvia miltiorrhiza]|uniref:uncharacterized protein LOC130992654 n=1 Tax=Salvia miltiorrhiza TaxID=226208 RepID=UPI0025AB7771|nr:uncharacterized protein LOC130992654 [Salvia miltiorrhiza]